MVGILSGGLICLSLLLEHNYQYYRLGGYAIVACSSGKHKGESHISYRGRKRLRYVLYEAAISLIGQNAEFKELHRYYLTRQNNPLKKMESVVAVACKALRVFYAILTKCVSYDGKFMLESIRHPEKQVLGKRIEATSVMGEQSC